MNNGIRITRWGTIGVAAALGFTTFASAGAGAVSLAVRPTELVLVGSSRGVFTLRNSTDSPVTLTAAVGNYKIKSNGTVVVNPKVPRKGSAKRWLSFSPKTLTLNAHKSGSLNVASHPAKHAGPGDHNALILFTTGPKGKGKVLVRTRIAVAVLVRIKGKLKRKLVAQSLSANHKKHRLTLTVYNKGNINERLPKHNLTVTLKKGSRVVERISAPPRDILPRSRSVYELHYRHGLKGKLTALVTLRPVNGAPAGAFAPPLKQVRRTFHIHS